MLNRKDVGILLQIIKRSNRINNKISKMTFETFYNDEDTREIICFNVFQIGELANNLSYELTEKYNSIPWKLIKGIRNRIVHGYDTIDFEIIWNTAIISIKTLKEYCEEILNTIKV